MKVKIRDIESRVYALLDENETMLTEMAEYCDPGVELRALIRQLLPDAARVVLCSLPVSRFKECRHIESPLMPYRDSSGRMWVDLPGDYLRLVYFRMSDWRGGVRMSLAGEELSLRYGRATRLTGRTRGKGVAEVMRGDEGQLEIFGSKEGAVVAAFDWIAVPEITDTVIDIPLGVTDDLCAKLAEMVKCIISD